MIEVRRLAVLRELHRCGTVAAAASALHLTPSAVSQHLAALGRESGTPLVEQHGRRLRLTGAGLLLLQHAEAVLAELERAEATLGAFAEGNAGVVNVVSFATGISGLLVPAMRVLRQERPGLQVQVRSLEGDAALDALLRGDVDCALWIAHPGSKMVEPRRLVTQPLVSDVMDVVLPATHHRASARTLRLEHLTDEAWVAGMPNSPCRRITEAACAAAGFTPRIEHCTDDWIAVIGLIGAGAGVALVPRLAQPAPPDDVVIRRLSGEPPVRHIQLLMRPAAGATPHLAALAEALTTVAADLERKAA